MEVQVQTKICCKCDEEKNIDDFGNNKNYPDGKQLRCKVCYSESAKKDREKHLERFKNHNKKKILLINIKLDELKLEKGGKCCKCQESRLYVLDFHHLDPSLKIDGIRKLLIINGLNKWNEAYKEVKKCILLCSNCHREFHYLERNKNITLNEYLNKNCPMV